MVKLNCRFSILDPECRTIDFNIFFYHKTYLIQKIFPLLKTFLELAFTVPTLVLKCNGMSNIYYDCQLQFAT